MKTYPKRKKDRVGKESKLLFALMADVGKRLVSTELRAEKIPFVRRRPVDKENCSSVVLAVWKTFKTFSIF